MKQLFTLLLATLCIHVYAQDPILNQTTIQSSANMNIDGKAVVGTSLGIGTGTTTLSIKDKISIATDLNNTQQIKIKNSSDGASAEAIFRADNNLGRNIQLGITSSGYTPYGSLTGGMSYLYSNSYQGLFITSDMATGLIKFAAGSAVENMRLNSTGNLLINTTTDDGVSKLQVNGVVSTSGINLITAPATATGTPDILTWNPSTKAIEKISSTGLGGIDQSNVMDKSTDQTIGGIKTFTSPVDLNNSTGLQLQRAGQPLLRSVSGGLSLGIGSAYPYNGMVFLGDSAGVNSGGWGGNIGIGMNALRNNQQGHNVAIGPNTLRNNNNYNSVAIGVNAGNNSSGSHLIAIGPDALNGNSNSNNVGLGRGTLASSSSGGSNIAIGTMTASGVVGSNNVVIGVDAGKNLGSSNIVIGSAVSLPATANNQINIGNVIFGKGAGGGVTASATASVGIGTANLDPDAKLTVAGLIHSREVKVTIGAGADFVFEKDYNLTPLSKIEEYISENKHLPEIASAADMKINGLELGEMNIKLLQKVEELTLHLIEQNKQIKAQADINAMLAKRLEKLEKLK